MLAEGSTQGGTFLPATTYNLVRGNTFDRAGETDTATILFILWVVL